jgi:hypothetical protein
MVQALSSPNRMTWLFAESARSLASEAEAAESVDEMHRRAVAAIVMAVACVESYLNAQARLLLHGNDTFPHRQKIESDLRSKRPLGRKLEEWPPLLYGKSIDFGQGHGQRFKALLQHRNKLMHFISDVETIDLGPGQIQGLFDTTAVDDITGMDAWTAVMAAEEFVGHLLDIAGTPSEQIPNAKHHWLGTPPPRAA